MRSFGSARARVRVVTAVAAWLSVCDLPRSRERRPRRSASRRRSERDEKVRVLLTNFTDTTPPPDLATQVSQVMTAFEAIVRRFPTSGYADNALFQARQPRRRGVPAVQSRRRSRSRAEALSLAGRRSTRRARS